MKLSEKLSGMFPCTCTGFVLQYEGSCQCDAKRRREGYLARAVRIALAYDEWKRDDYDGAFSTVPRGHEALHERLTEAEGAK